MRTEQEIKSQVTPEIIKKMVELADGFKLEINDEFYEESLYFNNKYICLIDYFLEDDFFPLLIYRTIEGWNTKYRHTKKEIDINSWAIAYQRYDVETNYKYTIKAYPLKNYQTSTLTACECAMLDCLIEVLK